MAFDKAKAVRAAEKYLAQNKISSAIGEYRQIVENDPSDINALNTLGDLYVRVDRRPEAVTCFKRVAEHYHQQGFSLKAIAVYKKITRFEPKSPEIAGALAALYEQQGLMVDARAQYMHVADAYAREGQTREALEVMRRIADLDPNNISIRLRLAESFLAEGLHDQAAEAFVEAGQRLLARDEHEKALDALTKALTWRPHSHAALHGLLEAHTALGTADEAAAVLEHAVALRPGDLEQQVMLVRAHLEAENAVAAERVLQDLVNRDPSNLPLYFDTARLHLRQGNVVAAVQIASRIIEPALSAREDEALLEVLQESLASDPEQMEALRLLVRIHKWQRDDDRLRVALENMAETAETLGLEEDERAALAQLVRFVPDEPRFYERLMALGGIPEGFEGTGEEAREDSADARRDEVPTFESFMVPDEPFAASASGTQTGTPDAGVPHTNETEFEWNSVESSAAPPPADTSASFADLNFELTDSADSPRSASEPTTSAGETHATDFDFSSSAVAVEGKPTSPVADEAYAASVIASELESVDFYLAQGYTDIARNTLDMIERQYGALPEIQARRERLGVEAPTPFVVPDEAVEITEANIVKTPTVEQEATPPNTSATTAPAAPPPSSGLDAGLAAIFDEFREAVEDEDPSRDGDFETHYNLGLAYKEMEMFDQAVEEFQKAANMVAPGDGTPRFLQCCNMLGHCFMGKDVARAAVIWFKKGLAAPNHTEDEYQALRYELGTAYERMGELDKAIETFTEVYGADVSYRGVAQKLRDLQSQRATK
jgi:tetratricopeptide (TPR) repeat protein